MHVYLNAMMLNILIERLEITKLVSN